MLERRPPPDAVADDRVSNASPPAVETRLNLAAAVSLHVCAFVLGIGAPISARTSSSRSCSR